MVIEAVTSRLPRLTRSERLSQIMSVLDIVERNWVEPSKHLVLTPILFLEYWVFYLSTPPFIGEGRVGSLENL